MLLPRGAILHSLRQGSPFRAHLALHEYIIAEVDESILHVKIAKGKQQTKPTQGGPSGTTSARNAGNTP